MKKLASNVVILALCIGSAISRVAEAQVFVRVPNASELSYQTGGNAVYLRNVNQFDSNALGCCYNYWIDTSSQEGKNIFALVLMAIGTGQALWLGLPNGYASGAVTFSGNW